MIEGWEVGHAGSKLLSSILSGQMPGWSSHEDLSVCFTVTVPQQGVGQGSSSSRAVTETAQGVSLRAELRSPLFSLPITHRPWSGSPGAFQIH
jgi:hypothetical protein